MAALGIGAGMANADPPGPPPLPAEPGPSTPPWGPGSLLPQLLGPGSPLPELLGPGSPLPELVGPGSPVPEPLGPGFVADPAVGTLMGQVDSSSGLGALGSISTDVIPFGGGAARAVRSTIQTRDEAAE